MIYFGITVNLWRLIRVVDGNLEGEVVAGAMPERIWTVYEDVNLKVHDIAWVRELNPRVGREVELVDFALPPNLSGRYIGPS